MPELDTGTRIAHYKIVSPLGAGGMGEVYKAYDPTLERHVALKLLPLGTAPTDDALRRFAREAKAASGLNHPNIITVYEIGQAAVGDAAVNYIAMELVEGKTLREFLSSKFEMEKALLYLSQTAEGLAKAHSAGIVHRDLKPENIMITVDGYAKILDFGLAKSDGTQPIGPEAKTDVPSAAITREGMVMGTVGYMSPEQVRGYGVDSRSDIFSLGCILYEAATHRQPFRGNSAVDTFHKIAYEPPPPMTDADPPVTPELQRLIRKSLAKDPDERYQSAKEIAIDLREIRREYESGGHLSGAAARPALAAPSRRSVWMISALALMAIVASIAFILMRRSPSDRHRFEAMTIERLPNTSHPRQAAISPDGRTIAHVESGPKGEAILVRQLSSGSEIVVAPADGDPYRGLTFSKDGESIRYIHRNALLQASVLGGPPKRLIDNVSSAVTFSPDGKRCAFVRDRSLFVAASDGSDPRRIGIRGTKREFYSRPAWSPRDDVIACTVRFVMTLLMGIEIVHPSAAESAAEADARARPLGGWFAIITSMEWLPDGSGLVVSAQQRPSNERQLYEIRYPDGRIRRITNDLFHYEGVSLTADGTMLVSQQTDKRSIIWLVPRDHPEKATRLIEGVGVIWDVNSLPDGGFLYTTTISGNADIWRSNADGSERKQLTDDPHDDSSPAVSPDGRFIVFVSNRVGAGAALWRMDMDGSNPVKISSSQFDTNPAFSLDGKTLYFASRRSGSPAVWRMPADGSSAPVLTSYSRWPRFSPRTSRTWGGSPEKGMIADSDAAGKIVISNAEGKVIRVFDEKAENIRWSRDSKAITYSREGAIYLQNIDGGPPRTLADFSPDEVFDFDWTADGKSLLCVRTSSQGTLVVPKNFR